MNAHGELQFRSIAQLSRFATAEVRGHRWDNLSLDYGLMVIQLPPRQ